MEAVDSSSSPRDHLADSNPDLARKKQRRSDRDSSSPDDVIVIEASDPEDIGVDPRITVNHGSAIIMDPYKATFRLWNDVLDSPEIQLSALQNLLDRQGFMEYKLFMLLSDWLSNHIDQTQEDGANWKQHYLFNEVDFFSQFAHVCITLLDQEQPFDITADCTPIQAWRHFERFIMSLGALSVRIIPHLPEALKTDLARRDSVPTAARQQSPQILRYLTVASRVINSKTEAILHFRLAPTFDMATILGVARQLISTLGVFAANAKVTRILSTAPREMKDSWAFLLDAIILLKTAILESRNDAGNFPKALVDDALEVLNNLIMPAIREKHPRALPDHFHSEMLDFGATAVRIQVLLHDKQAVFQLYELLIKSEMDVLLSNTQNDVDASDALWNLSGGNIEGLADFLTTSWLLQQTYSLFCSSVMDVRNIGLTRCCGHLHHVYNSSYRKEHGSEHPQVQHVVRFLKQNEVAKYIFGAESHASLVLGSRDIMGFLAFTGTYTNYETDVIWQACSMSVEADFVKASFVVLTYVLQPLDLTTMSYVLHKYLDVPLERLGSTAIDFLPRLLHDLDSKAAATGESGLSIALTNVKILRKVTRENHCLPVLENHCLAELGRKSYIGSNPATRLEISRQCAPDVANRNRDATAAINIFNTFLATDAPPHEKVMIAALSPMPVVLGELCHFVDEQRSLPAQQSAIMNLLARVEFITRLIALDESALSKENQERLVAHLFGDAAISNAARDAAWAKLDEMSAALRSDFVDQLVRVCLDDVVPQLPAEAVTPKLVHFIGTRIGLRCKESDLRSDPAVLLDLPSWKALMQMARSSTDYDVVHVARNVCLEVLFTDFGVLGAPWAYVEKCHAEFARRLVDSLCHEYEKLSSSSSSNGEVVDSRELRQGLELLDILLFQSSRLGFPQASPGLPELLELDNGPLGKETQLLGFRAEIHDFRKGHKSVAVKARDSTKIAEFRDGLVQATGAPRHRLFIGGLEISEDLSDKTLAEAGITEKCLVFVSTRYLFTLDTYHNSRAPIAPMEQQIMSQYSSLEAFLDGPDDLAHKAYCILQRLPFQAQSRLSITSPESTANSVFPPNKKWRSMFSARVLLGHLHQSACRGVVDLIFVTKAVELLTGALLGKSRPFDLDLHSSLAAAMLEFLRERPDQSHAFANFKHHESFVSQALGLLFQASDPLQIASEGFTPPPSRRALFVETIYDILAEAFTLDDAFWTAFEANDRMADVHEKLLLHDNAEFAFRTSHSIRKFLDRARLSRGVAHVYWLAIVGALPRALGCVSTSEIFFDLACDVLGRDAFDYLSEQTDVKEEKRLQVREVAEALLEKLWHRNHSEDMTLCWIDKATGGLLKLLGTAITALKSHKRPLEMPGLATKIFNTLLFPSGAEEARKPLVHKATRDLAYNLINLTVDHKNDTSELLDASYAAINSLPPSFTRFSEDWIRPAIACAGLTNLGMTCYMNSLLQQLFANVPFRKFLMDLPVRDTGNDAFLFQLQLVFAKMQEGLDPCTNPVQLANTLGIQFHTQEDVHGFYAMLLARLEDCMPDAESKAALLRIFSGESITQIRGDCGHVSARTEKFSDLSITVKNKASLHESLSEFVQGEPMEGANKYKCMTCDSESGGRLVNALRRTCLEAVPPTLTFCLKRFTYDLGIDGENKVNDRFEFPGEIDMARYTRTYLENPAQTPDPDIFELVGVIVHHGSLAYGHYWSHVRLPNASSPAFYQWAMLEDSKFNMRHGGLQDIQGLCFGGDKYPNGMDRTDNAYVLFYQRREYVNESHALTTQASRRIAQGEFSPPRLAVPDALIDIVHRDNRIRQQIEFVFDDRFALQLRMLMGVCANVLESQPSLEDEEVDPVSPTDNRDAQRDDYMYKIGDLAIQYLMKVLIADPRPEDRITPFMSRLNKLVSACPHVAVMILEYFSTNELAFKTLVVHESKKCRNCLNDVLQTCLMAIKLHQADDYERLLTALLNRHSDLLGVSIDGMFDNWEDYFRLPMFVASCGMAENQMVMDYSYVFWALETINLRYDEKLRDQHRMLYGWLMDRRPDFTPLYALMYQCLSEHADLSNPLDMPDDPDERIVTERGVRMTRPELQAIMFTRMTRKRRIWPLCQVALEYCEAEGPSKTFPPGQLLGLLARNDDHYMFFRQLEEQMLARYEQEQDLLEPMLCMTVQICANRPDQDAERLLKVLAKNLEDWNGSEDRTVELFQLVTPYSPVSVIVSMPEWVPRCLQAKGKTVRSCTAQFVEHLLFSPPPLSEDAFRDYNRVRSTRSLLAKCIAILKEAYQQERSKSRYVSMCDFVASGKKYLEALISAIEALDKENEDENGGTAAANPAAARTVLREMRIEANEAGGLLVQLTEFCILLSEWTVGPALPTRFANAKLGGGGVEVVESEEVEVSSDDGTEIEMDDD